MAKNYLLQFGSGIPSLAAGLSPTMIQFRNVIGGQTLTAPGVTAISTTGLYYFTYAPSLSIAFVCDGATTGLVNNVRYISGIIDPADAIDEIGATLLAFGTTAIALGTTNVAIGTSNLAFGNSFYAGGLTLLAIIGSSASSFGSTSADPSTIYGYVKRLQEFNEGNSVFNKSTNVWDIYTRGSSTLLIEKTLADASGTVTKS